VREAAATIRAGIRERAQYAQHGGVAGRGLRHIAWQHHVAHHMAERRVLDVQARGVAHEGRDLVPARQRLAARTRAASSTSRLTAVRAGTMRSTWSHGRASPGRSARRTRAPLCLDARHPQHREKRT
jgi:hypothetical protein